MQNQRQNSYDLLRIISAAAVVIIHINLEYIRFGAYIPAWYFHIAFDNFTRFCVPCFFMISGAFILNNEKNADYRYFYKKVFFKTVLPFLMFVVFYLVFDVSQALILHNNLVSVLKPYVTGREYNLWFMYIITAVYVFVPFLVRLKSKLSVQIAVLGAVMWTIASVVLMNLTKSKLSYSPIMVFSYMSFFLLGAVLYGKLSNMRHPWIIFAAAFLSFCVKYALRMLISHGIINIKIPIDNQVYFFPFTILGSVLIFLFFGAITVKRPLKGIADKTYYVYLTHTFIMNMIISLIGKRVFLNAPLTVLFLSAAVAALAYIAAFLLVKIQKFFRKKAKGKV